MKIRVFVASALLMITACSAVNGQWPARTFSDRNVWEFEMSGRVFTRPGTNNVIPLVNDNITFVNYFDAERATDLNTSAGPEFRIQRMNDYEGGWEVRGWMHAFDSTARINGELRSVAFTPPNLPTNSLLTRFDYDYESDLASIEVNFKRYIAPGLSVMIGPRYVRMNEETTIDTNFTNPLVADFLQIETRSSARNPLKGVGIGIEYRQPIARELFFVGVARGGIFHNATNVQVVSQATTLGTLGPRQILLNGRDTVTAGVGELSGRFHYDIVPGNVSAFVGYDALWLDGVAIAPRQILSAVGPLPREIETNTIFMHGVNLGVTCRF